MFANRARDSEEPMFERFRYPPPSFPPLPRACRFLFSGNNSRSALRSTRLVTWAGWLPAVDALFGVFFPSNHHHHVSLCDFRPGHECL